MKPEKRSSGTLHWDQARERLRKAQLALEEASTLTPERAKEVLESRARELARPPELGSEFGGAQDVVLFGLGNERYAIGSRYVREVVRLVDLTPLPGVAPHFAGVTNVRGEILLVVDLRAFFGIAAKGVTDLTRVVVLGNGQAEFGLLADSVDEVSRLRPEDLGGVPESALGIGKEYLKGVTRDATIVLDPEVLLKHPRLTLEPLDRSER